MTTTREPHNVPHQLNIYELDVDTACTGFGRHNRLVGPFADVDDRTCITLREDRRTGLRDATESERRRVLNGPLRIHGPGRLVYVSSVTFHGFLGESVEHTYRLVR